MKSLLSGFIGITIGAGGMWAYSSIPAGESGVEEAPAPQETAAQVDKPAYLVVLGDVYDRDAFISGYSMKLGPLYEKYGGEYIAVGRNKGVLENGKEFQSFVISKWPSMDAARAFWADPEYDKLRLDRIENGWSEFDVYLLEGLPETQGE